MLKNEEGEETEREQSPPSLADETSPKGRKAEPYLESR